MKHKFWIQRMLMPQAKLEEYYRNQRAEQLKNDEKIKGIRIRSLFRWLLLFLIKMESLFLGLKYTVLEDKGNRKSGPVIFAITHVGRFDIETSIMIVKKSAFFMWGDPGALYKSPEKLLINLIGAIFVDTGYKEDRYVGKEMAVKLLEQGGNLLIFPEGAWNITENEPVMPLFDGTAEIAIRTNAEIIPIAMNQKGRHYYVKIGENISPKDYTLEQKKDLTAILHESLCTLKWEIWEHFPLEERSKMPEDASSQYLDSIMCETDNGYTVEEIIRTKYHRKEASPDEVFAFRKKLK